MGIGRGNGKLSASSSQSCPQQHQELCSHHRFGIEQQPRHQHQTGKAGKETHNIGTVLSALCEGTHRGIGCPCTDAAAQSHESRKKRCQIKARLNDAQRTTKALQMPSACTSVTRSCKNQKENRIAAKGESLLSIEASDSSRWSIA